LVASKWPNSIAISEWFFKLQRPQDKRLRMDSGDANKASAVDAAAAAAAAADRRLSVNPAMDPGDEDQTLPLGTTLTGLYDDDGNI